MRRGSRPSRPRSPRRASPSPRAARARAATRPPPATLVVFDALSAELLAVVDEASRGGRDRTLAIATSPHALDGNGVWQLLARGASDAFDWCADADSAAQAAARLQPRAPTHRP